MANASRIVSCRGRHDLAELAYRIRYRGYRAGGFIAAAARERFCDAYDEQDGSETFVAFSGTRAIGTIRLVRKQEREAFGKLPAGAAFIEAIRQCVPSGARVMEVNRFVIDPDYQGARHASIKRLLFKAALSTAVAEQFRYVLAAARQEHLAFYARLFGAQAVGHPVLYPGLTCPMRLMMTDLHTHLPQWKTGKASSLVPSSTEKLGAGADQAMPAFSAMVHAAQSLQAQTAGSINDAFSSSFRFRPARFRSPAC